MDVLASRLLLCPTDPERSRHFYGEVLGLQVASFAMPAPSMAFAMRPELVGHWLYGRLHGGVISAALDVIGSFGLMIAIAEKHPGDSPEQVMQRFARFGTIDLRVDFLRQGVGSRFTASTEVTRLGSRVGSTQMRLVNEQGLLIATGAAAYMVS